VKGAVSVSRVRPGYRRAALLLAGAVTLSLGVLVPFPIVRALLEVPVALLLPGAAIIFAAESDAEWIDAPMRWALVVMLSLAFYPLLSLTIYAAGLSLDGRTIVAGTDVVVVAIAALLALRRRGAGGETAPASARGERPRLLAARAKGPVMFAAVLALAGGAAAVTVHVMPKPVAAPYSVIRLAGSWAHLSSALPVEPGTRLVVPLAIDNRTHQPQTYRIAPSPDLGGPWPPVVVQVPADRTWVGSVQGVVQGSGCLQRLTIGLFEGAGATPVATVGVWLDTGTGPGVRCTR